MKPNQFLKYIFSDQILLAALALALPLHRIPTSIITALIFIKWLIQLNKDSFRIQWKELFSNPLLYLILYYLLQLISLSYTSFMQNGLLELQTKLSFLLLPLVFLFRNNKTQSKIDYHLIFKAFIVGLVIHLFFSLGTSFQDYQNGISRAFYYSWLGKGFHPTYYSLYLNLALSYLIVTFFDKKQSRLRQSSGMAVLFTFLASMIILLSSKAGLIGLGSNLLLGIYFMLRPTLKLKKKLIFFSTYMFLFVFIQLFPYSLQRFALAGKAITNTTNTTGKTNDKTTGKTTSRPGSTQSRIIIWNNALDAIKLKPILGYGAGSTKAVIHQTEIKNSNIASNTTTYDAHNQFLQTLICTGLIGLLSIILFFISGFGHTIRYQHIILLMFLLLCFENLLFESIMERQVGVSFIAFFGFLFIDKKEQEL